MKEPTGNLQVDLKTLENTPINEFLIEKPKLYEIFVPVADNNGKEFSLVTHILWDEKVIKITGGLTLCVTIEGKWLTTTKEKMIPVRIVATSQQMAEIAELTMEHYDQEAVMYYVVSPDVTIVKRNEVKCK